MNKSYKIECLTDTANNTRLSVRIKRGDEKVYDFNTKKFQSSTTTNINPLIPLAPGTGLDQWLVSTVLDLDPGQFTDGDYTLYFHDENQKIFEGGVISIYAGEARKPNPTDVASRIMSSQAGSGTVRDALAKIK